MRKLIAIVLGLIVPLCGVFAAPAQDSQQGTNPFSALFEEQVLAISGLGASSATFCHYNRRLARIGSLREALDPDGPNEHAVAVAQRSASAGPWLLQIGEY